MSKSETLTALLADGSEIRFGVEVSEREPWTIAYKALDGIEQRFQDTDLFKALQRMRKDDLEKKGYQLLCAGARPDVAPSGMSRSMGGGRKAYIMRKGRQASRKEMVDIFEYAEPTLVGTVEQQQIYFQDWIESLRKEP